MGAAHSRQNHPSLKIPHLHWQCQEGALKFQVLKIKPPFPQPSILNFMSQQSTRDPGIPEFETLVLLMF